MAEVSGDIEDVDNVLKITRIHLNYRLTVPLGATEVVQRAMKSYAAKCPAYQSVKGCIQCTWEANITEK